MKIEKIKNFNQVILAVAGVLGLILLFIVIVAAVRDLLDTWNVDFGGNTTITNSLISEEKVETKYDILLVFFTAEKDSNKDGLVNFNDDATLCLYSLKNGKMHRIAAETNSITDYQFVKNSKDLLVEFSLSQYNDVKFKSYKPRKIMKYEFETEKLSEVVPAKIQQQLQNLVEGKKIP